LAKILHINAVKDPVVQAGDPVLRAHAKPIPKKDIDSSRITKVISLMKKTLAAEEYGVAIAAPQIDEALRIFVVAGRVFEESDDDTDEQEEKQRTSTQPDRVFINPEITRLSRKKSEMSEGCLSVRGKYGTVMRHEKASIKALDENGKTITYHGTGLIGHIFQHECDHLDGILYIDKAVRLEEDEDMKSARSKLKEKHGV
jgi:peptide deformylase